ncbi:MAG TPA: DUF3168 domain-containing protein [Candidatus Binatia bacterium]|nr:DUF3168 domain-containing protein [Candidatus Binatia bacterium]
MTLPRVYVDAEDVVKSWLLTTSVAPLVSNKIYMAMPKGTPLPSVILSRVGGSPQAGSDVPADEARISFDIYASQRPQAKAITAALVSEIESLAYLDAVVTPVGRLDAAEVINVLWLPDPVSDTPRYIVDARMVVRAV